MKKVELEVITLRERIIELEEKLQSQNEFLHKRIGLLENVLKEYLITRENEKLNGIIPSDPGAIYWLITQSSVLNDKIKFLNSRISLLEDRLKDNLIGLDDEI